MLIGGAIFAGPVGLIMLEPDAGQAITYFPILAAMFFLSGIKIRYVVLAVVAAAIFIPAAWIVGVKTGKIKRYQQERILAITDPDSVDPRGFGYHTIQSTITVGKGGLDGYKGRNRNLAKRFEIFARTAYRFHICRNGRKHGFYRLRLAIAGLRAAACRG